jgi:murein DD-endopeptidase MepM/ murein hydrolase activator NlpD
VTPQVYTVKEGDSLWSIARAHDMYVTDIVASNGIQEDSILNLGQSIILSKPTPLITVVAQVEGNETVVIPYKTITENDNSVNGIKTKTEGQNGEKFIAYTATLRNGIVENKEIIEEKVVKAAVDKVLVKGRSVQVASRGSGGVSTGKLAWPVSGSISQSYGNGHTGLDIAGPTGSAIGAADGGVVTFAGWQGGYGNFVIIKHGNGMVTRYAHCSKLLVKSGQKVSQGQTIGLRGSTGRSTGPHLHFEVMVGGSFRNPINYLR